MIKTKEQAQRVVEEAMNLYQKVRRCGVCLSDEDETLLNSVESGLYGCGGYIPSSKVMERLRWLAAERCW